MCVCVCVFSANRRQNERRKQTLGFSLWLLKSTLSHAIPSSKSGDPRDVKNNNNNNNMGISFGSAEGAGDERVNFENRQ